MQGILGLNFSTGDYISFIDSDDYLDLDMLEYLVKNLEEKDGDIAICGTYIEYENGENTIKRNDKLEVLSSLDALIRLNSFASFNMSVWNKIYKREVINNIFFPINKKSEDFFVMYQYFDNAKRIVITPEPKYHYIQRENSISRGKKITHDYIEASYKQKEFFEKYYPDYLFVANTVCAFAYIATYNRYIKYKVKLSDYNKRVFKKEVKKYINDVRQNNYLSKKKKIQAIIFSKSLLLYKIIMMVVKI